MSDTDDVKCTECGSEHILGIIDPIYGCLECGNEFGPKYPETLPSLKDA